MLKQVRLLVLCILGVVFLSNCSISRNINISESSNASGKVETANLSYTSCEASPSNTTIKDNTDVIKSIVETLKTSNIQDCWAGYDDGLIFVSVQNLDKRSDIGIDSDNIKYEPYLIKNVFDRCINVDVVWLFVRNLTGNYIYIMDRGRYKQYHLDKVSSNPEEFQKLDLTWENLANKNYAFDNIDVLQAGTKYDPQQAFKKLIKDHYSNRLVDINIEETYIGMLNIEITVNGLPENGSVNNEIAWVFAAGFGRFNTNLQFDNINKISIRYNENQNNIFEVSMIRGTNQDPTKDFLGWLSSGLNSKELLQYAAIEISDPNFRFPVPDKTQNESLSSSDQISDLGYHDIKASLEGLDGVNDLLLGYNGDNYNAIITINDINEQANFTNEMDITLNAMKYPIDGLWFIVEDENGTPKNVIYLDRSKV